MSEKEKFRQFMLAAVKVLRKTVASTDGAWNMRGAIDILRNIYQLSGDTKLLSKLMEINIYSEMFHLAHNNGYAIETANKQNYYPDFTFVKLSDSNIKFALDVKTTVRKSSELCNGFTLGSHGEYFVNRLSKKNIQYPYSQYCGHFCLGILYDTCNENIDTTKVFRIEDIEQIVPVALNIELFVAEKWKISSDKPGSGNTANIGSIKKIPDLIHERGVFVPYGEELFDEYWTNYGKIKIAGTNGVLQPIINLASFLRFKNMEIKHED